MSRRSAARLAPGSRARTACQVPTACCASTRNWCTRSRGQGAELSAHANSGQGTHCEPQAGQWTVSLYSQWDVGRPPCCALFASALRLLFPPPLPLEEYLLQPCTSTSASALSNTAPVFSHKAAGSKRLATSRRTRPELPCKLILVQARLINSPEVKPRNYADGCSKQAKDSQQGHRASFKKSGSSAHLQWVMVRQGIPPSSSKLELKHVQVAGFVMPLDADAILRATTSHQDWHVANAVHGGLDGTHP